MERCNVCSEKSYCNLCMHCEKKICEDCKSAHMDILRREINRINNQIRRGVHRLQDILAVVEKNTSNLQNNCHSVSEEIDEIYRRLTKAVKDRTDYLRHEMDKYLTSEMKNLSTLKENLELEISNITSNCDLSDKYMNETVLWEDCELMDTKEIFLKTVEFIRNFECENSDYSRRVRFTMMADANQLVNNLCTYGDLNFIHPPTTTQSSAGLLAPASSGLMRSKSDHRLVSQFRQQQESSNADDEPLLGGRKFGERPVKPAQDKHADSRYGGGYDEDQHYDSSRSTTGKNRFRSRFVRGHHEEDDDNESGALKGADKESSKKITSTEDAAKGDTPRNVFVALADLDYLCLRRSTQWNFPHSRLAARDEAHSGPGERSAREEARGEASDTSRASGDAGEVHDGAARASSTIGRSPAVRGRRDRPNKAGKQSCGIVDD